MKAVTKAIGIDLGGTRVKAVLVDDIGNVLQEVIVPTLDQQGKWKDSAKSAFNQLNVNLDENEFYVGLSAPGIPDKYNKCIQLMPGRLEGIEGFNWTEFLGREVFVVNDAVAALSAEARFGAAKNCKDAVIITIGTGVGGALLINGKIHQGAFQKAGHIGHMSINLDGEPDICGMPGSLEEAIGNYSINKRSNGKFRDTAELIEAMKNHDSFAHNIWLKSIKALAVAIASLGNILSPEKIILAGGITRAGSILTDPLEKFINEYEWRIGENRMQIEIAHFGEQSGAIGAAAFSFLENKNNS
ncbi:MAG: sugar kinase [Chitinophagaceae bacterium]|nr:MAG: sugar kinase [Chitinophagaceae bacterium]